MAILYVDLLGMKSRYRKGGIRSAQSGNRLLVRLIAEGLDALPSGRNAGGGIQSDAACLTFESTADAVAVGQRLFRKTFRRNQRHSRVWIRGVILDGGHPDATLESEHELNDDHPRVMVREFWKPMLKAIHAEQSGFKGQRLLIADKLVTAELSDSLKTRIGVGYVRPFHKLRYSSYPTPTGRFQDVLWPEHGDPDDWKVAQRRMSDRLRWAMDGGNEEFLHASATHLLFLELDSIIHGLSP